MSPDQQIALVPGVFSAPVNQYGLLQDYFDYADQWNEVCDLPLGSRGVTGLYDGCRIWIVAGWLADNYTDPKGTQYVGMLARLTPVVTPALHAKVEVTVEARATFAPGGRDDQTKLRCIP